MIRIIITTILVLCALSVEAKTLLSSRSQLTLVGGFKVPAAVIDNENTKYTSGALDLLPGSTAITGRWLLNHGVSGYVVEMLEPSEPDMTFPSLTVGRHADPMADVTAYDPAGVQWISEDEFICSGRKSYRSSPCSTYNWVVTYDWATDTPTLLEVGHVDETTDWEEGNCDNKLWAYHQSFGGGFTRIPSDFANLYTGGRTIGLARGGYDTLLSPMGPSLGAFQIGDTLPTVLLNYPYFNIASDSQTHYEIRDTNYVLATYGTTPLPLWTPDGVEIISSDPPLMGPTGDNGYFIHDNVSSSAGWINDVTMKGVVYGITSATGTIDYAAQGDDGSGTVGFMVYDSSVFYDGDPAERTGCDDTNNRNCHSGYTEFAALPDGTYQRNLYVYDPDCLAQVAGGSIDEWECTPTIIPMDTIGLPEAFTDTDVDATKIGGVTWDDDRNLLWILYTKMHTDDKYAIMAAYQLSGGGAKRPWSIGGSTVNWESQ